MINIPIKFNTLFIHNIFLYILIKIIGTLFALYVFNYFTPLVDAHNYIEGYYASETVYRTLIIQKITTFIVNLTNPLFTHYVFSFFSGLGILILSCTMKNKFILLLLLFPSAMVWTSIVGKEAIFYGCITLILAVWSVQINNVKRKNSNVLHLTTFVLLGICLILRPHYTIPFIYLLLSSFILYTVNTKKLQIFFLGTILFSTSLLIFYIWSVIPENLMRRAYGSIDHLARASRFEYYNIDLLNPHLVFTKELILRDGIFGIIGPFPSELLLRFEFIPFFIEGIMILTIPLIIAYMLKKTKKYHTYKKYFYYAILPAIFMLIISHAPFGILNPGTAIRWRVNFELIFYAAPLILYLLSKGRKGNG